MNWLVHYLAVLNEKGGFNGSTRRTFKSHHLSIGGNHMKWFRLYNEVLEDPKVQKLPPETFKFWINILCLSSKSDGKLPSLEDISFALRLPLDETKEAFHACQKALLIDEQPNQHGSTYAPHNWRKRQYKSDTSTERVKRFRNGQRNGVVTAPDTEQKQIQIQIQKQSKRVAPKVALEDLTVNHISDWLSKKRMEGKYINHDENHVLDQFKNYCESKGKRYANYIAGYRNAFEWDRCKPKARINDKHQRTLEAAARGHIRAENPDF